MTSAQPIDYLHPDVPAALPWHEVPLIEATDSSVAGYGCLVDDPVGFDIEIVRWPAQGWRPVDEGTGDEAGFVEGIFHSEWQDNILRGKNEAVDGDYILGWSCNPQDIDTSPSNKTEQVLLWHMNYHPDGGQLFFPLDQQPFVVPVAKPGDDLTLQSIIAFYCDGSRGLYIHPNIWHEGVFTCSGKQSFLDRQGRVHARVSCNIAQEFGVFLQVPLNREAITA